MSTMEEHYEGAHTPLMSDSQGLENRTHLEIPGSGIKRRLGMRKIAP